MSLVDSALLEAYPMDVRIARCARKAIRYADNSSGTTLNNDAIDVSSCEDALMEDNVIDLPIAYPIRHRNCTVVRYFDNTNPAGQLIQWAFDSQVDPPVKQDELTTHVEDATTLCIL